MFLGGNTVLLSSLNVGEHWITVCMSFDKSPSLGIFDRLGNRGRSGFLDGQVRQLEQLSLHLQNLYSVSTFSKIEVSEVNSFWA